MMNDSTKRIFVKAGQPVGVIGGGDGRCQHEGGSLVVSPDERWGNPVFADACLGDGDFHIHAKLSLDRLAGDGASILLGGTYDEHWTRPEGSHTLRICLDEDTDPALKSMNKQMRIVYGVTHPRRSWFPADGATDKQVVGACCDFFQPGEPFTVDITRQATAFTLTINGREVFRANVGDPSLSAVIGDGTASGPVSFGFVPGRGTLRIQEFHAEGAFLQPSQPTVDVWQLNRDGYSHFRSPALCTTRTGQLLAFAEARRSFLSRGWEWEIVQDIEILSGEFHCAMKVSDDAGRTWSAQKVVVDQGATYDARFPSPLLARDSGELFLFIHGAWGMSSCDNGLSWSEPNKLNDGLPGNWKSGNRKSLLPPAANGAIQLQYGPHRGRLVVVFHLTGIIALMLSDDNGKSWQPGALAAIDGACNPTAVELSDGRVLVSPQIRPRPGAKLSGRPILISTDGGASLTLSHNDPALPASGHAAMAAVKLTPTTHNSATRAIACCGSADTQSPLELKVSFDDGATWPVSSIIDPCPAGTVALAPLPNAQLGILYERHRHRRISFQSVDLNADPD